MQLKDFHEELYENLAETARGDLFVVHIFTGKGPFALQGMARNGHFHSPSKACPGRALSFDLLGIGRDVPFLSPSKSMPWTFFLSASKGFALYKPFLSPSKSLPWPVFLSPSKTWRGTGLTFTIQGIARDGLISLSKVFPGTGPFAPKGMAREGSFYRTPSLCPVGLFRNPRHGQGWAHSFAIQGISLDGLFFALQGFARVGPLLSTSKTLLGTAPFFPSLRHCPRRNLSFALQDFDRNGPYLTLSRYYTGRPFSHSKLCLARVLCFALQSIAWFVPFHPPSLCSREVFSLTIQGIARDGPFRPTRHGPGRILFSLSISLPGRAPFSLQGMDRDGTFLSPSMSWPGRALSFPLQDPTQGGLFCPARHCPERAHCLVPPRLYTVRSRSFALQVFAWDRPFFSPPSL